MVVRSRGIKVAVVVVAGLALTNCALAPRTHTTAADRAEPQLPSPSTIIAPTTSSTSSTTSATSTTVAAPVAKFATVGAARVVRAPARGPASVAAPRWDRFDGELTGASHEVARVAGASIDVSPHPDEAPATTLSNASPAGAPRVFLVVHDGGDWLQVLLPLRPNSSLGWVRRSDVDVSTSTHRVEIDRAAHRIRVFDGEQVVLDDAVAVGKASTPTPSGQFFTIELLQPTNPNGAYGPYAFTLSAYSNVYQTFGSGDGAVGMHGTNEQASIGTDASHGCVRLHNDTVRKLATLLPLGTPVFIR